MSEYPSLPEQGKNMATTAFKIMQGLWRGEEIYASKEVQDKRQEICNGCPSHEKEEGRCKTCGCVLDWKIPFAMSDCPEEKWGMDQESFERWFNKKSEDG